MSTRTTTTTPRRSTGSRAATTVPAPAVEPGGQQESPTAAEPASTVPASLEGRSELVHLDPRTLLIEGNVRRKADLDEQFVDSVRRLGVLVPIVAVKTEQGVQVRYGQRRTLAAIEAHRPSVPVMLLTGEPGPELDRIIEQWHENEHRAGLSVADQASAARQLSMFGLSAEQIRQRLGASQPRIAQALQVGASELATKAAERYDLTLDQAVVIAEFFLMWTRRADGRTRERGAVLAECA
jgi:ParB family chromosome partitioning protein